MKKEWFIRWSFFTIGLIIMAFGITLTIKGEALGIGPWDVFHYGLSKQLGLTIGAWSIIAGFVLIFSTALAMKKWPQIGTLLNMLLVGVFIDIFNFILPNPDHIIVASLVFLAGVVILAYGIGIYVAPGLGAGPRDQLMLVITEKTGWSVKHVRNGIEVTVLIAGWLLGGPVGIGTIIIALLLGTLVQYALPQSKALMSKLVQLRVSEKSKVSA
ncbi:YczE/YyaS/YitT family protein [Texcoconibacillus texcoconensis]|uniref:YitT family protein n=1 Tax=Texcoconibacillus texcoconensis TaxID=1095777 RepID=A0A840QRR8_9BACI|nr:YitT family protein [Texcoconibacillus texcoconensis]MBB5174040.1 hypothetical protein [Texcoconibacillus texcoconensis]